MKTFLLMSSLFFLSLNAYGFGGGNKSSRLSAHTPTSGSLDNARNYGAASANKAGGRYWVNAGGEATNCLPKRLIKQMSAMGKYFNRTVKIESAYRSKKANAALYKAAKNSLHMRCKAVDFTIPGVSRARIRGYLSALWRTGSWGIGFYCKSDKFHLDTGTKRTWGDCYPREIKNLIPRRKRKNATAQSAPVPNYVVNAKTSSGGSSASKYQRSSASSVD